jgi:hypothetical protein
VVMSEVGQSYSPSWSKGFNSSSNIFKCLIYRREALLVELMLDPGLGSDHWFICCDSVLKCSGVEPLSVIG